MLRETAQEALAIVDRALERTELRLGTAEIGTVSRVSGAIAAVRGLADVRADELVRFRDGQLGIAGRLGRDSVGVILLGAGALRAGDEARRTGRVVDVPVGEGLLGRVVDAVGRPLDDGGPIRTSAREPIELEAPAILERAPVNVPLQTGLKVVDALIPIGRGQRQLVVGDRQSGKTAVAVDTIVNQPDDVLSVYCAIGQRASAVARVIADLRRHGALERSIVVVAGGDDPPGMQFVAPYAATTMAERFARHGRDVLVVYDDLTRHARTYRELSLLLRRPPGREAYPGDIFYVHSRLLERATHFSPERGGGSLTALPIVETQAQNLTAYIPTNLISITDGQIYLSPDLFRRGILPAVDVGRSVSRVGGKAQLPAYRAVAGRLRLAYAQFEELEVFARFGARLDEETRRRLERGRRVREVLKQPQYSPLTVPEQIAVLLAATEGLFDAIAPEAVEALGEAVRNAALDRLPVLSEAIENGAELGAQERERLLATAREALDERGLEA